MIKIFTIVAFLIGLINQDPSRVSQLQQLQAIITQDLAGQEVSVQAPTVQGGNSSVNLTSGNQTNFPASSASAPQNPILGTISISSNPNNDGSYSITGNLGTADHIIVELVNTAKNDDFKNQSSVNGAEVTRLYDLGDWTYTVTSYDVNGASVGTTQGSFTLGQ